MSIQLKLFVQTGPDVENTHTCDTIINIRIEEKLFAQINELQNSKELEKPVFCYGFDSDGTIAQYSPYGEKLRFVNASDCANLQSAYQENKAALAYLTALDKNTMVVFYWH